MLYLSWNSGKEYISLVYYVQKRMTYSSIGPTVHLSEESTLFLSRQLRENGASKLIFLGWNSCDESWFIWPGDASRVGVLEEKEQGMI